MQIYDFAKDTYYTIMVLGSLFSSSNAFISGSGSRKFKFRSGQIGHSVAYGSTPLRHFFKRSCVACWCKDAEMALANSLHASA